MPYPPTINPIGQPFIELSSVDSTNNYAMAQVQLGLSNHGTVFFAHEQISGKGQRGKIWNSNKGENIILSAVLEPLTLTLSNQFIVSAAVGLACYDLFKTYAGNQCSLKWPNDLFWRDRKAGGILIENLIQGATLKYAIAGIGININQVSFPNVENAVSLKEISGKQHDILALAKELCWFIDQRYEMILSGNESEILQEYNSCLYKKDQKIRLRLQNIVFETVIRGVNSSGNLLTTDSIDREFGFGEVVWVN